MSLYIESPDALSSLESAIVCLATKSRILVYEREFDFWHSYLTLYTICYS